MPAPIVIAQYHRKVLWIAFEKVSIMSFFGLFTYDTLVRVSSRIEVVRMSHGRERSPVGWLNVGPRAR